MNDFESKQNSLSRYSGLELLALLVATATQLTVAVMWWRDMM